MTEPRHRARSSVLDRAGETAARSGSHAPSDAGRASLGAAGRASLGDAGGRGPRGMWWVAWRQHRLQLAVMLALMAVFAAAQIAFRDRVISVWNELGCAFFGGDQSVGCTDANGTQVWWNDGFSMQSSLLHNILLLGPVMLGAFAAAPIFTREFSHGTQILALTQNVGRARWFATKTFFLVVPLVGGLLALGYLMRWVDGAIDITAYGALYPTNFFSWTILPAAVGLMAFALTIAVGILVRNVVGTLVVGLFAAAAILAGVMIVQPYVLPATRTVKSITEMFAAKTQTELDAERKADGAGTDVDKDARSVDGGYLDIDGTSVGYPSAMMSACYDTASKAAEKAAAAAGLTAVDGEGGSAGATVGGSGGVVAATPDEGYYNSAVYVNANNASMVQCLSAKGIAAWYSDILPGSLAWPLRWAVTGILAAFAALFFGVGAWRLRWAVAKR